MANANYGNALQGKAAVYRSKRHANKKKRPFVWNPRPGAYAGHGDVIGKATKRPDPAPRRHVGGSSRSSGKMYSSGNAYHNGPGAASTGRRDNAGNLIPGRSNASKAGRLRRKFSGEFGGAEQIRKFRKPKRLKIHRNPGGIVR